MKTLSLFVSLFLCLGLGACSSDEDNADSNSPEAKRILGKWILHSYAHNGEEYIPEACEEKLNVEFFSNGTATYTQFWGNLEAEECMSGTYNEDWEHIAEDIYEFTEEDAESYTVQILFSINNNTLTVTGEDENGTYSAVYIKELH